MKTYLSLAFLSVFAFGCSSDSSVSSTSNCEVYGSVQTTISDGFTSFTDVPDTSLNVDSSRQFFEENLSSTYIDVSGLGFVWSVSGSLQWTGELTLDSVVGLESGLPHNARIFYKLNTADLSGLVFLPSEFQDSQGTISATLTSEYRSGSSFLRTRYSLGLLPDYIQTSSQVIMDWRYIAATNEIHFGGTGYLDLGELNQEGWTVNPVVSVCLGADVFPF